jgi:hypothetical protein
VGLSITRWVEEGTVSYFHEECAELLGLFTGGDQIDLISVRQRLASSDDCFVAI